MASHDDTNLIPAHALIKRMRELTYFGESEVAQRVLGQMQRELGVLPADDRDDRWDDSDQSAGWRDDDWRDES